MGRSASPVVIMGAGPAGLAAGMLLARSGLEITVLDKDPSEPPDTASAAWEDWSRHGVAQFRLAHTLLPGGAEILQTHLPEIFANLTALGAHQYDTLRPMPPTIADQSPRPGDDRFISLAARRPVYELAFAHAAAATPNLQIRRGTAVTSLVTGGSTIPGVTHVRGVELDGGTTIDADLVIDASGRRSPLPALLEAAGGRPPSEQSEDSRFVYYSRFYRKRDEVGFPEPYGISLFPAGSISVLTLAGDNDTWSTTLFATTADKPMRAVRDPDVFERVVRSIPARAAWVDGEPITDVAVMAGISDRERSMFADGEPVATGIVPVSDAWACTNPSLGRGISMALMHVVSLVPALLDTLGRPAETLESWHTITREGVQRFHRSTLRQDRLRNQEMDAIRTRSAEPTGRASPVAGGESAEDAALFTAMMTDPEVFRAVLEVAACMTTLEELGSRPGLRERVAAAAGVERELPPQPLQTRVELERLLA